MGEAANARTMGRMQCTIANLHRPCKAFVTLETEARQRTTSKSDRLRIVTPPFEEDQSLQVLFLAFYGHGPGSNEFTYYISAESEGGETTDERTDNRAKGAAHSN